LFLGLCALPAGAERIDLSLKVRQKTRKAIVDLGRDVAAAAPVVFVFHHGNGTSAGMAALTRFSEAWPEATIVYLQGIGGGYANVPGYEEEDVEAVEAILDHLKTISRVDERRIYATGFSNGGYFTMNLLWERPERFAAFAPVAASGIPSVLRWAAIPRPVLMVFGKKDALYLAERSHRMLLRLNDCSPTGTEWEPGAVLHGSCVSGQPVLFWTHDGGHDWAKDATARIVRFFQDHALPAPPAPRVAAGELTPFPSVAGTGKAGLTTSARPASTAPIVVPTSVSLDGNSNLYFMDDMGWRIRKVGSDGLLTTPGGLANPAISFVESLVADREGNLYMADTESRVVRRLATDGTKAIVAGTRASAKPGKPLGSAGDGGPATQAELSVPLGLAVDKDGNLYIADSESHRIRRVDRDGNIATVVGTGVAGFAGDGGPALQAQLHAPTGLAIDRDGSLWIADTGNHRVRKVTPDGTIRTVAGTGARGFSGDGGPAAAARLHQPMAVAVDSQGNAFVADGFNYRVRKVAADGIITTVFANEPAGEASPPPGRARFYPESVAIDRDGNLLVADPFNHRIWKVPGVAAPGLVAGQPFLP
jgi:sugar lactone lactonase YvrE/dienelactone hydrolase